MRFSIISIGDSKKEFVQEGERLYLNRLTHYLDIRLVPVSSQRITRNRSIDEILFLEAEKLLKKIPEAALVVAMDVRGSQPTSEEFTKWVETWRSDSVQNVVFLIGGAHGLHPSLVSRADKRLSLSRMTFPHEMARLILIEQIYRAMTILRGEQYHK